MPGRGFLRGGWLPDPSPSFGASLLLALASGAGAAVVGGALAALMMLAGVNLR